MRDSKVPTLFDKRSIHLSPLARKMVPFEWAKSIKFIELKGDLVFFLQKNSFR